MRDSPAAADLTPDSFLTPFIIGVTGHMKLPPEKTPALREKLRVFFRWLKAGEEESFDGLGPGLGLTDTPVVLLSSMAPGVDQIAAEVAREDAFGFRVVAPLPFPPEQYLRSTTFTSASDAEKAALGTLPHESFYVELASEAGLAEDEAGRQREACLTGDAGRTARYAHLRASGEYVAAYCDLLLAVTDLTGASPAEEPASFDPAHAYECGAVTIIRVRRHGITPGLLPVEPALPWADAGPVVYLPWQKAGKPAPQDEGRFRLHSDPHQAQTSIEAEREVLIETADLVHDFNRNAPTANLDQSARKEMHSMLGLFEDPKTKIVPPLPEMAEALHRRLLRIAGARSRSRDLNRKTDAQVKRRREEFLWLGVLAATLLQIHDHWEPVAATAPAWVAVLRTVAYFGGLACAVGSLIALFRFQSGRRERDQIDSRCIAEGLRVQFYWTAAGTAASAASNYLLRQRGVIRWIINAVASASYPYEPGRSDFRRMTLAQRCALLERAVDGWLCAPGKKGQIGFNRLELAKIRTERAQFQLQGRAFLIAGLLLSLVLFGLEFGEVASLQAVAASGLPGGLLATAAGGGLVGIWRWLGRWGPHPLGAIASPDDQSVLGQWLRFLGRREPGEIRELVGSMTLTVLAAAVALVIAALVLVAAVGGALFAVWLPSAMEGVALGKGILFALSARAFVSTALRFHTENLRNYSAMLSLFESGHQRLELQLGQLRRRCAALPQGATTDPEAEHAITAIQDLLLALGREALSEHAEWLHLHRDRPVSPNNLPNP